MIALHDAIRAIVLAFNRGDSRREDIRFLADKVQELQEAAQQYLNATSDYASLIHDGIVTKAKLKSVLKQADHLVYPFDPKGKKPA